MHLFKHSRNKQSRQKETSAGFTLMELLVVLAILGLLASFAVPRVLKYFSSAKTDTAAIQINNLSAALDLYRLETGRYPTTSEGLRALIDEPDGARGWDGPYIDKREGIIDPWGRPYHYRYPGEMGTDVDIFTLGADDAPGGENENQDVTNWSTE
ncbi:type II secretion system protein GspG [Iodidimonas gelatinilytica]|uniref:Type II secretion system core protein G n=1 Tax=Iodidimonas gelatinilytica TaxID=1236966 RepID=A0A5A7MNY7_9PROT|nr:type II secretion system major pseudopilin GspG [Iodidimonas gelatinilytica]GEQ96609.1 type II secretion system protein GspG [Iodidimonas gelatinilytica]